MSAKEIALGLAGRLEAAASLNAVLHWSPADLAEQAAAVDARGPTALEGMPVAVKDNMVTSVGPTTCGSKILEGYQSPFEATVITRLRAAGALIAAKTNLDEFAMGSSTEHSAYGRVHHPFDPSRVPGGSSGGSAALVGAGVVPAALGSETGGSVRQPASFCGVVGVKPSYGTVSRYGLVAFGSSLDCVSVFGRTVDDAARVLHAISGHDPLEATSLPRAPIALPTGRQDLSGLTVGLPAEYFPSDLDAGVRAATDRTVAAIRDLGAQVVPVALPHSKFAVPTYYIIAPAEASANLARYDGVRYGPPLSGGAVDLRGLYRSTRGRGFGAEVRRRILTGTYVLSSGYYDAYYRKAQQMRSAIAADFQSVFATGVDLLFTPTTPTTAFKAGEKTEDPVSMYLADIFVSAVSLAGLPGMSIPIGRSEGLPIGGQLIAPFLGDTLMMEAAGVLERHVDATGESR